MSVITLLVNTTHTLKHYLVFLLSVYVSVSALILNFFLCHSASLYWTFLQMFYFLLVLMQTFYMLAYVLRTDIKPYFKYKKHLPV